MKYALIASSTPTDVKKALSVLGCSTIELPPHNSLPSPTASHPDMLIFQIGKIIFCSREYFESAREEFKIISSIGYEIIVTEEKIREKYPGDILFNGFIMNNRLYCKADGFSSRIKDYALSNGIEIRNVRQGYAKCSVCMVEKNAAITADMSIAKILTDDGVEVLKISEGNILLPPYNTGFIGGCSGVNEERIYFSGNIDLHPDGNAVRDFCKAHGKEVICLSEDTLFDVGTIFFFETNIALR